MKQVEKFIGVSIEDVQNTIPSIKSIYAKLAKDYNEQTHPRLKILDSLIVFTLISFIVQLFYAVIVGKDPFNALLAGLFASLG